MTGQEMEITGKKVKVASTVDAVGLFCPIPMVKLKLALENVEAHQIVEILADDPAFPEDLKNWCQETDHNILSLSRNKEGVFVAYVEKS